VGRVQRERAAGMEKAYYEKRLGWRESVVIIFLQLNRHPAKSIITPLSS
jgi:hypothetical protein